MRLLAIRSLAALLAIVLGLSPACGSDADTGVQPADERTARVRADLDRLIETGLQSELPPPMPREEQALYSVKLHRRQIAGAMARETASALAPLALAAAVFVPQGPADLVLSVFPVHHLGDAARVAKTAFQTRARNKRSRQLLKLHKEFEGYLSDEALSFFQLAQKFSRAEQRAIATLARHTGSPSVVGTLMTRHLRGEADVVWLAGKLERTEARAISLAGKLERSQVDGDFVRRFTFDGDFVREFTEHEAHLSWSVLQKMVENQPLKEGARGAMARKLHGLLGERAAVDMVHGPAIVGKYFKNVGSADLTIGRGVGYRTLHGRQGSIDIVARTDSAAVYIEVKNLAAETWARKGTADIMAQLKRHNRGIGDIRLRSTERSTVAGKVLMVAEKGFKEALADDKQKKFTRALKRIGWKLELIPERRIMSVTAFLGSLK